LSIPSLVAERRERVTHTASTPSLTATSRLHLPHLGCISERRTPDTPAAGKDDALQPPTPPQHVRVPARPILTPPAALPMAVGDKKKGGEAADTRAAGAWSPSLSQVTELSNDMV